MELDDEEGKIPQIWVDSRMFITLQCETGR